MLAVLLPSIAGIFLDPRLVTGAPVWLKPAKFAASTGIFAFSIAWLFRYMTMNRALKRNLGLLLGFILMLEVGLIDLQAWRGVASHFDISSPVNSTIYAVMGTSIGVLWATTIFLTVALFRQSFANAGWGSALRYGMLISVLGAGLSGFMLRPTPEQSATMAQHVRPEYIGAHTVGAPDGGPGIEPMGWSKQHGDLRIPHFFGLHALQILPLLALLIRRKSLASAEQQTRMVLSTAVSYGALLGILTWQALRGQSIIEPDGITVAALAIWFCATAGAMLWSRYACVEEVGLSQLARKPI